MFETGSLNLFYEGNIKVYQKQIQKTRSKSFAFSKEETKILTPQKKLQPLKENNQQLMINIQRYKQQLQSVFNTRKKHPPKSMIVEKPQSALKPQLIAIPQKNPNFLGLFDMKKVYEDKIQINTLQQKHHLLKTVHDVKSEQNKDKMNSLLDQAFHRIQDELNNQSQVRSTEREQYIKQYETYYIPNKEHEIILQENSESSSQEEQITIKRVLKGKQKSGNKKCRNAKQIQLEFPRYRWSKIRGLSYQKQQQNCQIDQMELNSSRWMEQIMQSSNQRNKTDMIQKLDQIVNQIYE